MSRDEFLYRVAERAGLPGLEEAGRWVHTVLAFLGERLSPPVFQSLLEDLPPLLAGAATGGGASRALGLSELHERMSIHTDMHLGRAVESTALVCQALAEALSPGTLHRLHEALPEPVSALFTPRARPERREYIHLDPARRTLAEGRPGSRHPLSEARPPGAHLHSVVGEDNPHGDTKLSSSTGLTQEREEETLATGHPLEPLP